MKAEQIAKVVHEANRAYCQTMGDYSQTSWENTPDWQKESVLKGVKLVLDNPLIKPWESHNGWLKHKKAEGWTYGETKDVEKKTHPCMVEYDHLPEKQKLKDSLFLAVVRALG